MSGILDWRKGRWAAKMGILSAAIAVLLSGCRKETAGQPSEPVKEVTAITDVREITFGSHGSAVPEVSEFTLTRTEEGTLVRLQIRYDEEYEHIEDEALLKRVKEILETYDAGSWNGFHGADSMVLDGESFFLDVEFMDGTTLSASGNNSFPDNYMAVKSELMEIIEPVRRLWCEEGEEETNQAKKNRELPLTVLDVEAGRYYDYSWDEDRDCMAASLEYPYMFLMGEDRKQYPELEDAIEKLMVERKDSSLELYQEAIQASREEPAEFTSYSPVYRVLETLTVRRADTRAFSFLLNGYYYLGGAHGAPYILGITFDTETGKKLELTDVVTDVKQLPGLVREQLERFSGMDMFYENLDLDEYFEENHDNIQWVLDYYGLTFYFNPYDIAPYASGAFSATISFADHPELFREKYREAPAAYCVEFPCEQEFYYDADGDGSLDSLMISADEGEYGYYVQQNIRLNGESLSEKVEIFQIEPILFHTAEGKNYLYIGWQYPDDFWAFAVYDISGGNLEKKDMVYSGRRSIAYMEEEYYTKQALTNPESFILSTLTQILGTAYGYDSYHIGGDGLPVKEHPWYVIEDSRELTLRRPLTVSVVDEEGQRIGEEKLQPGETLIYYRTDGESWADLVLSDGRIVRIMPEQEDWLWTVDGLDIEEVFDGIVFAG